MDLLSTVLVAIALAMDAFAISLCKGLAIGKVRIKAMLIVGVWFGLFHFMMPLIGYYLGRSCYELIEDFDHWIAFFLLAIIGINMIREALGPEEEKGDPDLGFKVMLPLAVATSIDALVIGISSAMEGANIWQGSIVLGLWTCFVSAIGLKLGSHFGDRFGSKAEILGGIILVLIGLNILLHHLGIVGSE